VEYSRSRAWSGQTTKALLGIGQLIKNKEGGGKGWRVGTTITVGHAIDAYMQYQRSNSRPNSVKSYGYILGMFKDFFADLDVTNVPVDEIVSFLEMLTGDKKQSTKATRAGQLSACFNFAAEAFDLDFRNPFSRGILKKLYKQPRHTPPELLDKEVIDEIIYRSDGRDRKMLELMGRAAMRIGEVLTIRPRDLNIEVNTISLEHPKSGRQGEVVQIYQKLTRSIDDYVRDNGIKDNDRIFPISYTTAFRMVRRKGRELGVKLAPHDLRRHAATQASRAGKPLELVSKVILRHADIATTQRYLGKVSGAEASQMMESLYG
jgi:integrase/recombinase XerD